MFSIEATNLSRSYLTYKKQAGLWNSIRGFWSREYEEKIALQPTSLSLERGKIIGLVGANGAGKTTLLKLLSGLIHPTRGEAKVLGYTPWKREEAFLKKISILLGQKAQLWWDIPPADSFELLTSIYDLDPMLARKRVKELSQILACEHVLHIQLRRLSLGERMKMEIIGALLHEPEMLFLDEPTIGLDIVAQSSIRDFLAKYVKEKAPTVILTSHYMDDIAKLADQLLLISKGSIVYNGTVPEFIQKSKLLQKLELRYAEPLSQSISLSSGQNLEAGKQDFSLELRAEDLPKILPQLTQQGIIQNLKMEEANFEEIIRGFLETESRILPPGRNH